MPPLWNTLLLLVTTTAAAVPLLGLDLPREVAIRAEMLDDHLNSICLEAVMDVNKVICILNGDLRAGLPDWPWQAPFPIVNIIPETSQARRFRNANTLPQPSMLYADLSSELAQAKELNAKLDASVR